MAGALVLALPGLLLLAAQTASDDGAAIADAVIDLKSELEKIREQVENIE
mgnify:CR=1 FL=1